MDQSDVESSYTKLTDTEAFKIIEDCGAIGFVWYNKSAKITKIVFFSSAINPGSVDQQGKCPGTSDSL